MEFKKITIEDKKVMDDFLIDNKYGICDYSFSNIFIWKETYKTRYCIYKDFLILQSRSADDKPAFLMPLGKGNLQEVIECLIEYAKNLGHRFRMVSLTKDMVDELKQFMPDNFVITEVDGAWDYLYSSEKLIGLTGKKLAAKRNHINKFMSLYGDNYEYVEINDSNIEQCRQMNDKWRRERDSAKNETDFCAVETALLNFKPLKLVGGAIIVNGEMVALTMGQPNNKDVFDVLIEKALTHIEGAYPLINREFAARNCGNYMYINREEDLGIEGLRKAKLSYHPIKTLEKNMGTLE